MTQLGIQCPHCRIIFGVEEDDAHLLAVGARALVTCSGCGEDFVGDPAKAWTFHAAGAEFNFPSLKAGEPT